METNMRLCLFGDQTDDFIPKLRGLLQVQDHPLLSAFLDQAHYVLRAQMIASLDRAEHKLARTSSLADMASKYAAGQLGPAFQTALSCITQLGCFMAAHKTADRPWPRANDSCVLGFCTGALAAAAVSCSSSLSDLLPLAVQTVLIAFRLGHRAEEMRDSIEGQAVDRFQAWSVGVNMSPDKARPLLEEFCNARQLPTPRCPWITATAGNATTISGPPSVLNELLQSEPFRNLKHRKIPICVPAHNAKIFSTLDIRAILDTTNTNKFATYEARLPFISSVNAKSVWVKNYASLVELALQQVLLEPIGFDRVENDLPQLLKSWHKESILVISVCTSAHKPVAAALKTVFENVKVHPAHLEPIEDRESHRPSANRSKLAIVAMSGRFPEAQTTESFWDLLYKGLDVVKEVPERRWNVGTHVDPSGKARNKGATKWGCWLDFYDQFDPKFFSISPKEAPQMDPAQRMALMSTYEAMERGGIVPDTTPSTQRNRIGVFHGVTSNDWMETNTAQNIDTYFITGGNRGFIPGRINFCFEFSGPSYTNDTACSSSLAAIHLACNSLWRGDCDTAVAGGTNMIFTPDGHAGLDKGFFLSRTGNCKAFDDQADGYCRAEGVGTIFIKRLEDALADSDPILAVILDAKTNHSAMSESMTRPHAVAQIDNMTAVLNSAGVSPNSLSYLEMHGTGTQVGDAEEMKSVLTCFAPDEKFRGDNPLWIGSTKANVGHGEGVSGITSVIKTLLMMQNDTIPPHCGIKPGSKINRNYPDLKARNVHIAFEPTPWKRGSTPRRALINNFSAAGGNTALLLEDAPIQTPSQDTDPRTSQVVTVSAHTGKSLTGNLQALVSHLHANEVPISQLAYTTSARRWHHLHRVSVVGDSVPDITNKLEEAIQKGLGVNRPKSKPNVVLACTGQGSQYVGMGKELFTAYPSFRTHLQRLDQMAANQGLPSFIHLFASTAVDVDMDDYLPAVVQLAVSCLQVALGALLRSFGVVPSLLVGHSLGEYAALQLAGVISESDMIYLVGKRAELLQNRCQRGSHAMLAVRSSVENLRSYLKDSSCEVACINGPEDSVLSGQVADILDMQQSLSAAQIKSTLLKLPFAFHSAQVQAIMEEFEAVAANVTYRKPRIPILSPLLTKVIDSSDVVGPEYLGRHCRETVNMCSVLQHAKQVGAMDDRSIVVEVGPKPLLCNMFKATLGQDTIALPTLSPQTTSTWKNIGTALSSLYNNGIDLDWKACHDPFKSAHRVLNLPSYSWDLKEYYIPYEGDWCLHRHKIHCDCAEGENQWETSKYVPGKHTFAKNVKLLGEGHEVATQQPVKASKLDPTKEAYPSIELTTTLHRVVEEKTEPLGATFTVETDLSRKDVNSIAKGHTVDGIPLATPSFYADIAMQAGRYCMQRIRAGHQNAIDGLIDVTDLVVDKALIPHGEAPQLLRTTLTMSWPPKAAATTRSAKVKFATYFADGKLDTEHATCTVRFTTDAQQKSLLKKAPEYKASIKKLETKLKNGEVVSYTTKSGYKLMSSMAQFHSDYKLLSKLILNEAENEAVSTMSFANCRDTGNYAAHPAYIDAITQVGGFAMNANDNTDIDKEVYVNHGWDSLQIYQELRKDRPYQVYSKMARDKGSDMVHGDTIVFDGDDVVAFFRGLSLRSVPRKALRAVLQSAYDKGIRQRGGKTSGPPKSNAQPVAPARPSGNSKPAAPAVAEPASVPASLPPTANTAPAKNKAPSAQKFTEALNIISEESGIAIEDLTDETSFVDVGIDSLSSMVIGSRLREDLSMDLDPDFSLFASCPTVQSLKKLLGSATTEGTEEQAVVAEPASVGLEQPIPVAPPKASDSGAQLGDVGKAMLSAAVAIIAEESGVAKEDFTLDTEFTDVGIDSLCSMVISSRFREELDLDLDPDFSLFTELPTMAQLTDFFTKNAGHSTPDSDSSAADDLGPPGQSSTPASSLDGESDKRELPDTEEPLNLVPYCRATTSVILQGMPKIARKTLFMLPDGGGSASSYATIPRLQGDIAVVGLNCPYARDPENMNCTHLAMIQSFVNEIKRRQPVGPYHLGGWSSGGAFAYVTAEALVNMGEDVDSLIVIDAPVPQVMEKLPVEFYEHCNKVGLFANQPGGNSEDSEPPPFLIPHFVRVVDVMLDYKVAPLQTSRMPKLGLVWADQTVMKEEDAPPMKGMHFMIQKRHDFGPDGWDTVLPGGEYHIVKTDGANHFTLMQKPHVDVVANLIEEVMQ